MIELYPQYSDLKEYMWTLKNGKLWCKGTYLHQIVADRMGLKGKQISHIDQNPFNNRRKNLQKTTISKPPVYYIEVNLKGRLVGFATVNIQDSSLGEYSWSLNKDVPVRHETRKFKNTIEKRVIGMHYEVARLMGVDCDSVRQIKHKNKNKCDNRRCNLRFIW